MSRIALFSVSILLIATSVVTAQPPEISGYEINWFDEFDGASLDETKWEAKFDTTPTNNSLNVYLPGNVIVANGNLLLLSTDLPFGDNFDYRSGLVESRTTHRLGRFEVRAKLPTSTGMWPAIWLLPYANWPSQGEIDIMENRGNEPFNTSSAFHFGTNPPFSHSFVYHDFRMRKNSLPLNFHDSFHTYAVEWDPGQIRYYVDGVHHYTVRSENVDNFLLNSQTSPMRLIINTAIGGDFLADPDATTQWPQLFEIDYAYIYDRVGEATLEMENGDFELNDGSLSNWSLFGNNGANLSSDNSHAQSGTSSMKMFGQFNSTQNFSGVEQGVTVEPGDTIRLEASAFVDSSDSILGSLNEAYIKVDFYSKNHAAFASADYISSQQLVVANGATLNDQWLAHELVSTVPAGAVEARCAIIFRQRSFASGAVFVDDVKFTNLSASNAVAVESVEVESGNNFSGQLTDLATSDDSYYLVRSGKAPAPQLANVQLVFDTHAKSPEASSVQFELEGRVNTTNVEIVVEAFNFDSGTYDQFSNENVGQIDSTISVEVSEPDNYIGPGNLMRYRVSYRPTGPTLIYPWAVGIDRVGWTVQQ